MNVPYERRACELVIEGASGKPFDKPENSVWAAIGPHEVEKRPELTRSDLQRLRRRPPGQLRFSPCSAWSSSSPKVACPGLSSRKRRFESGRDCHFFPLVSRQTRRKGCRKSVIQMSHQLRKSALLADPGWL